MYWKYTCILILLYVFSYNDVYTQLQNDSVFSRSAIRHFTVKPVSGSILPTLLAEQGVFHLFVFLSPECPLSANYVSTLNVLMKKYSASVRFYGIVPGKAYSRKEVSRFSDQRHILFPVYIDESERLTRYLGASVTPEAILIDDAGMLTYKGAIDNWFFALGKSRPAPSEHYLDLAIVSALQGQTVALKRTMAVGCRINDF